MSVYITVKEQRNLKLVLLHVIRNDGLAPKIRYFCRELFLKIRKQERKELERIAKKSIKEGGDIEK